MNSWKFFEIMKEILLSFKALIISTNNDNSIVGVLRKSFGGFAQFLQQKNEEFSNICKVFSNSKEDIDNGLIKSLEVYSDILDGVFTRKGRVFLFFIEVFFKNS